jgi:hypothetical protein
MYFLRIIFFCHKDSFRTTLPSVSLVAFSIPCNSKLYFDQIPRKFQVIITCTVLYMHFLLSITASGQEIHKAFLEGT